MTAPSSYLDLDPRTVQNLMEEGRIILIDVREPAEHDTHRIEGARLHPLSGFDPVTLPRDPDRRLVLQCGSGKRSALAMEKCRAAGVDCHGHLQGGIQAWAAAGLPTRR